MANAKTITPDGNRTLPILHKTGLQSGATGVKLDTSSSGGDKYTGTADALIAAGIIAAAQLPGQPGMPKVAATFYNGVQWTGKAHAPRGLGYLNITRPKTGKQVTVIVGISEDARATRVAAARAEIQAMHEARQKALREPPKLEMDEAEYRSVARNMVGMLWRLGQAEGRSDPDMFAFELTDRGADKLIDALRQIWTIFNTDELQAITPERAAFLSARKDGKFQTFLREQCLPLADSANGESDKNDAESSDE